MDWMFYFTINEIKNMRINNVFLLQLRVMKQDFVVIEYECDGQVDLKITNETINLMGII